MHCFQPYIYNYFYYYYCYYYYYYYYSPSYDFHLKCYYSSLSMWGKQDAFPIFGATPEAIVKLKIRKQAQGSILNGWRLKSRGGEPAGRMWPSSSYDAATKGSAGLSRNSKNTSAFLINGINYVAWKHILRNQVNFDKAHVKDPENYNYCDYPWL